MDECWRKPSTPCFIFTSLLFGTAIFWPISEVFKLKNKFWQIPHQPIMKAKWRCDLQFLLTIELKLPVFLVLFRSLITSIVRELVKVRSVAVGVNDTCQVTPDTWHNMHFLMFFCLSMLSYYHIVVYSNSHYFITIFKKSWTFS